MLFLHQRLQKCEDADLCDIIHYKLYLFPSALILVYVICVRQAEEHLNIALQINKHDKSFMMLGKVHLLAGETDRAIEVYKRAVE